jgi:hypothetical protein
MSPLTIRSLHMTRYVLSLGHHGRVRTVANGWDPLTTFKVLRDIRRLTLTDPNPNPL